MSEDPDLVLFEVIRRSVLAILAAVEKWLRKRKEHRINETDKTTHA
jgi:hypothetical protein